MIKMTMKEVLAKTGSYTETYEIATGWVVLDFHTPWEYTEYEFDMKKNLVATRER